MPFAARCSRGGKYYLTFLRNVGRANESTGWPGDAIGDGALRDRGRVQRDAGSRVRCGSVCPLSTYFYHRIPLLLAQVGRAMSLAGSRSQETSHDIKMRRLGAPEPARACFRLRIRRAVPSGVIRERSTTMRHQIHWPPQFRGQYRRPRSSYTHDRCSPRLGIRHPSCRAAANHCRQIRSSCRSERLRDSRQRSLRPADIGARSRASPIVLVAFAAE